MDRDARAKAFERERAHLFALAYRFLGSAAEADDVLQDASMRFVADDTDVLSAHAFLSTMVVRLCLDHMKSARARRESYVGPWLPEPLMGAHAAEASPEERVALAESLSLAFLALLERLSPLERAAFLLREVFDYSFQEIALTLGTNEPAVRQLVARARAHVDAGRARFRASEDKKRTLLEAFVIACATRDAAALERMLASDVVARTDGGGKARAALKPIHGSDRVARFILGIVSKAAELAPHLVTINGEPGLVLRDASGTVKLAVALGSDGEKISELYVIANPDKLARAS